MGKFTNEQHFKLFTENLEVTLRKYGEIPKETLLELQRKQIKRLLDLEDQFRLAVLAHKWGPKVYREFVNYICCQRRNILAARPYFRERQTLFTRRISPALKKRDAEAIHPFRINWSFISFIMNQRNWGKKIVGIVKEISKIRTELLEQNLPLAINQSRTFFNCTPTSHLSFMDIVEIEAMGLLLAIDKFVPPNDKHMSNKKSLETYRKFRAVAIGIMTRDRVNQYSETLIHFYPKDKMKIYRANKVMRTFGGNVDYEKLSGMVNKELDECDRTTPEEIAQLVTVSSIVSANCPVPKDSSTIDRTDIKSYHSDIESNPDQMYEKMEVSNVLHNKISDLTLSEQKLLKMKGI
jgi:DNA-directed RNA polymerase specialized sigma subunit